MQAIAASGLGEVRALCEPERGALDAARAIAPDAQVVGSFGSLLELPLDGIVIATPSAQHAAQAEAALERGCAVFCQKPLGRNAAEVKRVVDAAARNDRLLGVDLSYRRTAAVAAMREQLRAGALGRPFAATLVFHNAYGPDKPWFYDPKLSGGGALIDLGVHLVDTLLWLLDFPAVERVSSQLFAGGEPLRDRDAQVEDYVAAQMRLAGGVEVQLACSWRLHAGCDCVIEASLYGSAGGITFRNEHGSFYDFSTHVFHGTAREQLVAPPDDWGGRSAVAWVQQLTQGRNFDRSSLELLPVARAIDLIYDSAGGVL